MQVSSSKSKFSINQFYKKVIENLANHKTQDSYFYDASDEVDKSQNRVNNFNIKDTIISKISQKDISDKLEKLGIIAIIYCNKNRKIHFRGRNVIKSCFH